MALSLVKVALIKNCFPENSMCMKFGLKYAEQKNIVYQLYGSAKLIHGEIMLFQQIKQSSA